MSAFKKYLFYLLAQSNNNSFANLSSFAFRKCNEYLYKSLINEQLNLSSPSEFNDPFDCPILALLKMYEDDVDELILKDQKLITYDLQDNRTEKNIEFYQIEMDLKHFGQLNAV